MPEKPRHPKKHKTKEKKGMCQMSHVTCLKRQQPQAHTAAAAGRLWRELLGGLAPLGAEDNLMK